MTKIIVGEECGNSPKNIFLKELTTAFARGNAGFILDSVTEDIRWDIVGDRRIQGKEALARALERMKTRQPAELTIAHIVTHGKAGAVNGITKLKSGAAHSFCDVYEFNNAKGALVKVITSYVIKIT